MNSAKAAPSVLVGMAILAVAAGPLAAETVVISREDCRRVVRHVASADVAYTPGVDARGRPVAPADLAGTPQLQLPETFSFDIAIDMRRYLGTPKDEAAAASAAAIAADKAKSA
ncbi:MAG: hypothetical protein IH568_01525, partial [Burkholderiaceae bacterium]|nr:hypothetical protein [Burkholderiaceae bacterium]